ncbi:uncharacterized protein LOC123208355 [Mangifera indica]|uniref:uncharacterized protein LOC123208355 n=1 Tax=Mangifera indica TaxID=29780 RepID=UPI001CF9D3F2|nr:uncharacterized protein LOC123208355 [Mangifera indica]XP_044481746.1 uncharacterized protein LOC123208355 [Mangifera indica]
MGVDAMRIGVQVRKVTSFSIRSCYRSVCSHPFLAAFVCFLILLYRSSPFIFSLLVSASPVLVCTAILLGTLLSFGKPNIPEIEKEEKITTHEIASPIIGVVEESTLVQRDVNGSFSTVDTYIGKGRDMEEKALDESILLDNRVSEVEEDGGLVDCIPLIDENLREIQFEKQVNENIEREFNDLKSEQKRDVHEEKPQIKENINGVGWQLVDNLYSEDIGDNLEVKDDKSPGELIDALKEDLPGSTTGMSWKRLGEEFSDNNDDDGEESVDSGSNGAESSSPDASMADIIPMLEELHPLLDSEAAQPLHISNDESDAGSQMSHKSNIESTESEEESDNDVEGEGEAEGEDDNGDDDQEGEAAKDDNEDESKSAIKWTEADQKNLMDLGTSELERNQRLENLIARRRARKNLRLMTEKNLIDLESTDLPFNVPPIATTRRNPFELPYDLYGDIAIPGSAPSILLPRGNPFDLPYDSNEEKPDLKGDSFQQEFTAVQQKEPVYTRNETFSVGASIFGFSKQERSDFRWKPYFVPEQLSSEEGTGYSAFQRQLSGLSESKNSSVPDTESLSSAVDEEDRHFHEQVPEQFSSQGTSYTTFQRQISETSDSKVSSVPGTESVSSAVDEEDKKLNEQDVSGEIKLISNIECATDHVEFESQSSEDVDAIDSEQAENRDAGHDEDEITLGHVENHHEREWNVSGTGGITTPEESNANESLSGTEAMSTPRELSANEVHLKTEPGEEEYNSGSSFSSLSEVNDKISDMREGGGLMSLEPKANNVEESGVSTRTSLEESEFRLMSGVMEQREPVYDSSPQHMEKFFSFASISPDTQLEMSRVLGYADESEKHIEDSENDTSFDFEEVITGSSEVHAADEDESTLKEVTFRQNGEHDLSRVVSSGIDPNIDYKEGATVRLFSSDISPIDEYTVYRGDQFLHEKDQVVSSSHHSENHQEVGEKLSYAAPGDQISDSCGSLLAPEEQEHSMVVENVILHTSEPESVEEKAKDREETVQPELDEVHLSSSLDKKSVKEGKRDNARHFLQEPFQVHSSSYDEDIRVDGHLDVPRDLDSVPLSPQHMDSNNLTLSKPGEQQSPLMTEQVPVVHHSLEADCVQKNSLDKGAPHQLEENQVQSSSESKIDSGLHQHMGTRVISAKYSSEDVHSKEMSTSELEKQLSCSANSPSYDDIDKTQELPILITDSAKEVNVVNNGNVSEVPHLVHEVKTLKNSSSLTSNSSSSPFESPESRSTDVDKVGILNIANVSKVPDYEDKNLRTSSLTSNSGFGITGDSVEVVKNEIHDRVVYGNHDDVIEHLSSLVESYGPRIDEENFNEEAGELREIDEGFLSELDTVGDFSVKEVGESHHIEPTLEETHISNAESFPNDSIPAATNAELPILEAKSIEDIVLAFKQLDEGVDVEEVILPSMLKDQAVVGENADPEGINSDLPVLEARSLEDIHAALKQISLSDQNELLKPLESEYRPAELEQNEVVSAKQIESLSTVESVNAENGVTEADDAKQVSEEPSESSSLSISNKEGENHTSGNEILVPVLAQAPVTQIDNENPKTS